MCRSLKFGRGVLLEAWWLPRLESKCQSPDRRRPFNRRLEPESLDRQPQPAYRDPVADRPSARSGLPAFRGHGAGTHVTGTGAIPVADRRESLVAGGPGYGSPGMHIDQRGPGAHIMCRGDQDRSAHRLFSLFHARYHRHVPRLRSRSGTGHREVPGGPAGSRRG